MSEPTQEQIKEFWKWCGDDVPFRDIKMMGHQCEEYWERHYPPIDLNNLFKYAVPMVREKRLWLELTEKTTIQQDIWCENVNPALALFWAIWEVIHKEVKEVDTDINEDWQAGLFGDRW